MEESRQRSAPSRGSARREDGTRSPRATAPNLPTTTSNNNTNNNDKVINKVNTDTHSNEQTRELAQISDYSFPR